MIVKGKTILLVEDNPDDEMLTLRAFKKKNLVNDVVVARDGVEALDCLFGMGAYEGKPVEPEVVLLDLNLPKVSGFEVLERIRNDDRLYRLPVVILTSSREEQDMVRSYDLNCNSYIRKPVDFEQFMDAIETLGIYWLVLNEPPPAAQTTS